MSAGVTTEHQNGADPIRRDFGATEGEICEVFSLTPRAVNFCEEGGLVRARRDALNRRRLDVGDQIRLEIVVPLRQAGVSIADIRVVLAEDSGSRASARAARLLPDRATGQEAERHAVIQALPRLEPQHAA
jgi:DNA-binding transcriptional MerR regulator